MSRREKWYMGTLVLVVVGIGAVSSPALGKSIGAREIQWLRTCVGCRHTTCPTPAVVITDGLWCNNSDKGPWSNVISPGECFYMSKPVKYTHTCVGHPPIPGWAGYCGGQKGCENPSFPPFGRSHVNDGRTHSIAACVYPTTAPPFPAGACGTPAGPWGTPPSCVKYSAAGQPTVPHAPCVATYACWWPPLRKVAGSLAKSPTAATPASASAAPSTVTSPAAPTLHPTHPLSCVAARSHPNSALRV